MAALTRALHRHATALLRCDSTTCTAAGTAALCAPSRRSPGTLPLPSRAAPLRLITLPHPPQTAQALVHISRMMLFSFLIASVSANAPPSSPLPCITVGNGWQCGPNHGACELNDGRSVRGHCCSKWGYCGTTVLNCAVWSKQEAYSNGGNCAPPPPPIKGSSFEQKTYTSPTGKVYLPFQFCKTMPHSDLGMCLKEDVVHRTPEHPPHRLIPSQPRPHPLHSPPSTHHLHPHTPTHLTPLHTITPAHPA